MKNILFVCTEGFDTPGPSNHLIGSLIEDLLENGFSVTLIQSRRKRVYSELPPNLEGKPNLHVVTIDRKVIEKQSLVRRYLEEASYAFRCFKRWKNLKAVDAVFVQSCPTVIFTILLLRFFMKKPILYSIQDMWPGSAVNSGALSNPVVASFFGAVQKVAYRYSDILTVISEDMKAKVMEQGVPSEKIRVIVNWFDDRTVHEVEWEENRFARKYELESHKFYVQYAGTMGYVFDYKMVLDVAELLKDTRDIQFQMIGHGSQRDKFESDAKQRGLKNIKFYPLEPQHMVSDVYSACSACLIPLKRGIIGNSVPSKAGLLMACNRVIVNSVDANSDYYRMFDENKMGVSAPNDNPRAVADAILDLYKNKDKRELLARNGHQFGKIHYSRTHNTKKFIELLKSMSWMKGQS